MEAAAHPKIPGSKVNTSIGTSASNARCITAPGRIKGEDQSSSHRRFSCQLSASRECQLSASRGVSFAFATRYRIGTYGYGQRLVGHTAMNSLTDGSLLDSIQGGVLKLGCLLSTQEHHSVRSPARAISISFIDNSHQP